MGFRSRVVPSTLADANELRDWRIYADFAQVLSGVAPPLYAHDPVTVDLTQSLYALDSTTIDLCLSLFPWAKSRKHKAAGKMHTLLDLHGNIPTFTSALTRIDPPVLAKSDPGPASSHMVQSDHELQGMSLLGKRGTLPSKVLRSLGFYTGALFPRFSKSL